jgi:hypothetical protein
MPVIAQITGAVALTALVVGPWWSRIPETAVLKSSPIQQSGVVPHASAVVPSSPIQKTDIGSGAAARPAHLNLDVRHSFASMDLSVTVDGKPALTSTLDGSGKRFKMFGKRSERGYTQTLDLPPGVRVVRVRLTSAADKFDQTRVERFELASASVAAIRIAADRSGMTLAADHPALPPAPKATPESIPAAAPAAVPVAIPAASTSSASVPLQAGPVAATQAQAAGSVVDLVQSLRSMLIAIAGFVASAATGFVVQEFMRRRRGMLFQETAMAMDDAIERGERRRRRRAGF